MVSIECVERGMARYIDEVFLPSFQRDGVKGFAVGVAASLLVKRGGRVLREYAQAPLLQQMGIVTADGSVDLDALRDAIVANVPKSGLAIELPMGIVLRINADDVSTMYSLIRKEANL